MIRGIAYSFLITCPGNVSPPTVLLITSSISDSVRVLALGAGSIASPTPHGALSSPTPWGSHLGALHCRKTDHWRSARPHHILDIRHLDIHMYLNLSQNQKQPAYSRKPRPLRRGGGQCPAIDVCRYFVAGVYPRLLKISIISLYSFISSALLSSINTTSLTPAAYILCAIGEGALA